MQKGDFVALSESKSGFVKRFQNKYEAQPNQDVVRIIAKSTQFIAF